MKKWQKFHLSKANLQKLCQSCHHKKDRFIQIKQNDDKNDK